MALDYQKIFGDDFVPILKAIDEGLPDEVERMVLSRIDQVVFRTDVFSNEITRTVQALAGSGVSSEQIENILAQDMATGGKIFGSLRNGTKEEIVNAMNQASRLGQFEEYGLQDNYMWVTVGGHKICVDCEERAGKVKTYNQWAKEGLPGSGWSICGGYCYCVIDPVGRMDTNVIVPKDLKAEKGATVKKPPPIDPNKILNKFIRASTSTSLKYHIEKFGSISLKGVATKRLNSVANAIQDTLGKYNISLEHLGVMQGRYKMRKAHAAAFRDSFTPSGHAITIQKTYLKNPTLAAKNSRKGFEYRKKANLIAAKNNISYYKEHIKRVKDTGKERFVGEISYYERQIKKQQKIIDLYSDPMVKQWAIPSIADDPLYATIKHESWHQIDYQLNASGINLRENFEIFLKRNNVKRQEWYHVSEYAGDSIPELWAETGTALDLGYYVPEGIKKAFIETIQEAGFDYP